MNPNNPTRDADDDQLWHDREESKNDAYYDREERREPSNRSRFLNAVDSNTNREYL
jgi:hypothetical protein